MAFYSDKSRQGAAGVSTGGYDIDNSLRFNDNDSANLVRTPSGTGNRKTWTWSAWIKRGNLFSSASYQTFFTAHTGSDYEHMSLGADDLIYFYVGGEAYQLKPSMRFRDPSAWYHVIFHLDTTQAIASNRMKFYINGEEVTSFQTATYPPQDWECAAVNVSGVWHALGKYYSSGEEYDGYLAEVNFIDGQALTPSDFGETGDYGEWKPIEYAGTYGTNGFYLPFSNTGDKQTLTVNSTVTHSTTSSKIGSSSIKFNNSGYLYPSNLSAFDFSGGGDLTIEFWFNKIGTSSGSHHHMYGFDSGTDGYIAYRDQGSDDWQWNLGSQSLYASQVPSVGTWYHLAVVRDGSNYRMYIDGVQSTSAAVSTTMGLPTDLRFGRGVATWAAQYANMYIDEFRVSNNCRYPSGTTFTPSTTAFTDDANTLLLIHSDTTNGSTTFTDSSGVVGGLGNDASSNTNNWTPNNLASTDQMLDTPTNNFATLNPLRTQEGYTSTFSEGNLKVSAGRYYGGSSTIAMDTGKWYGEFLLTDATGNGYLGIVPTSTRAEDVIFDNVAYAYAGWNGSTRDHGTYRSFGDSYTTGDLISIAVDMDNSNVYFAKNGTWQASGDPTSGASGTGASNNSDIVTDTYEFLLGDAAGASSGSWVANFGQDSSFAGNVTVGTETDDNGYGSFKYDVPDGFLALCTKNLPDPAVIPSEHFNTVLYTANESTLSVTGVGFQPDFVWIKSRASTRPHTLFDVIRGVTKELFTNQTSSEETYTASLTAFDSDGFSLGDHWDTNEGTNNHVAWNWKANGTGASNTNGTINTTATSANTDAGFSISTYTGNGTAGATVGHGLSSKPDMMIVKKRSASPSAENWTVYHTSLGATKGTYLNLTSTPYTLDIYWNNTEPTNNVFSIGDWDGINTSGEPYVAYCFHSVDGYSKVGSFEGNASTSGNFIYTGFTPALVILHNVGDGGGWPMMDNARGDYNSAEAGGGHELLRTNSSGIEGDSGRVDLLSNGFRPTVNYGEMNAAFTYVYIAFAESPFKHTNAK
jgi:hypothetical protein